MFNNIIRPRRLRTSLGLRKMMRETRISPESLIWPIFIVEGENIYQEIPSLPGQYHYSPDQLYRAVERAQAHGISRLILFGLPKEKDEIGSGAWAEDGVVQQGLHQIRKLAPDMYLITDVCMCEYTSHGHCGILCGQEVDNDQTLLRLAEIAVSHARAGADMVAPSDMMDGRVAAIRKALDDNGFQNVPIMSYAAKFASSFYGPFRDAAGSAPAFGDRRSYQMDWHNSREAMRECALDVQEGADILMIKPALSYLDLICQCRQRFDLPVAAYAVSGEYAMVKAAAAQGLIDEYGVMCESAVSIFRAGADILITYYAPELADAIRKGDIG
ncbi:MAG: porphobilinogen synthase [Agathobaculum sp.]|jgi:porphobilinogen synthase|uniref:porphobilinogen synthase n=1 Tax=Agathobaculum sp. TaxID=2048138 RepID=UPI003D906768